MQKYLTDLCALGACAFGLVTCLHFNHIWGFVILLILAIILLFKAEHDSPEKDED